MHHIRPVAIELTEAFLNHIAGWDVVKRAAAYLEQNQVASSYWAPPLLRGVVQTADGSFRASMVIKDAVDVENLCNCRDSREWGKICAHSVAVALHWLKVQKSGTTASTPANQRATPSAPTRKPSSLQRVN